MVETRSPLYFWVPDFAALVGKPMLMAALFGGLLAGSGSLVDSFVGRAEWKMMIPAYNVACSAEKDEKNAAGEIVKKDDCVKNDADPSAVAGF